MIVFIVINRQHCDCSMHVFMSVLCGVGCLLLQLSEFSPRNPGLLGLNVNRGAEVKIRLRPAHDDNSFYDWNHILGTMLHEVRHALISCCPHTHRSAHTAGPNVQHSNPASSYPRLAFLPARLPPGMIVHARLALSKDPRVCVWGGGVLEIVRDPGSPALSEPALSEHAILL
jgi:hypothetical protein